MEKANDIPSQIELIDLTGNLPRRAYPKLLQHLSKVNSLFKREIKKLFGPSSKIIEISIRKNESFYSSLFLEIGDRVELIKWGLIGDDSSHRIYVRLTV